MKPNRKLLILFLLTGSLYAEVCHIGQSTIDRGCWGFFGRIDGLGWQANLDSTQYAAEFNNVNNLVQGEAFSPAFDFQGAFRIGGGYITPCRDWIFESYWTHFFQKTTSNLENVVSGLGLLELPATSASAQLSLNFNLIDLTISRTFLAAPCFSWTPHFGLQGAIFKTKENIDYIGAGLTGPLNLKNNFNGVGLTSGIGIVWDFMQCLGKWSVIADSKISLLTGKNLYSNFQDTVNPANFVNVHYNYKSVRPIFDLSLGMRWTENLCSFPLTLDLAWESLFLPNIINWSSSTFNNNTPGNLSFSGITLSARIGF